MKVMQIHFWGDACDLTSSVSKVIDGFARMDAPDIRMVVASLGSPARDQVRHGKPFIHFEESAWVNRVCNKWLNLGVFTYQDLVALIERERPDILHVHNRADQVDALLARLSYRPWVVVHYHRVFHPFRFARGADQLIAVSEAVKNALVAAGADGSRVAVVHNPALIRDVMPQRPREGRWRFLYGGGAQRHKGFEELRRAACDAEIGRAADVLVCGPELEGVRFDQPWVRVLGMLDADAFHSAMEEADAVVMPSHAEGFGLLALEALGAGKLLVCTRAGGLAEIVADDCALIHPVGDADALRARLLEAIQILEEPRQERLAAMRLAGRRRAEKFSPAAVNDCLAGIYRRSLADAGSRALASHG